MICVIGASKQLATRYESLCYLGLGNVGLVPQINFIPSFQQSKRKLDDVAKKLEVLYDALREMRVSLYFRTQLKIFIISVFKKI